MRKILFYFISVLVFSSCVSSKQFTEVSKKLQNSENENLLLKEKNQELIVKINELQGAFDRIKEEYKILQAEQERSNNEIEILRRSNSRLESINAELEEQLNILKTGSSKEISVLLNKLQDTQASIQEREDELRRSEFELESKNRHLIELQEVLAKKDAAVKNLKRQVISVLTGFNNEGLSIEEKNGKVYVSMEERLLFKTAEWKVDENGKQALRNLSALLVKNPDVNIMIEGHTDNVPMHGSGEVKDNWDLSVMRATAVAKILLENKDLDPRRIISAGRSEFVPLVEGETLEDRQKNRRTEIILSPKLDEIFKLLEEN